jgi:hypothetical protein
MVRGRGALLWPNFGGEEGLNAQFSLTRPFYRRMARLWKTLFHPASRFIDVPRSDHATSFSWPTRLGPAPASTAFGWIEDDGAAVPWFANDDAIECFTTRRLRYRLPAPSAVRAAHDKEFARRVRRSLGGIEVDIEGLCVSFEPDELTDGERFRKRVEGRVADWPKWARDRFTVKPRLGSSGRGRLPGIDGKLLARDLGRSVARLRRQGGAVLEPFFSRTVDLSAAFYIHPGGAIEPLGTLRQSLTTSGSYLGHRGTVSATNGVRAGTPFDRTLEETSLKLACAAADAGYFGPCGVDAFAYRIDSEDGDPTAIRFRPAVEFNARFTFGIVALGLVQRALAVNAVAERWQRGERLSFELSIVSTSRPCPTTAEAPWTIAIEDDLSPATWRLTFADVERLDALPSTTIDDGRESTGHPIGGTAT